MRALVEDFGVRRRRPGIPRRYPARREGAARMGNPAPGRRMTARPAYLAGPFTRLGLLVIVLTCAADQASKLWVLYGLDLGQRSPIRLASFLDFTLAWNTRISYGWFQQEGPFGQWALVALKACVVVLLWVWLARATSRLTAAPLGLIIGGAIGNTIDHLLHGAVVDFVHFFLVRPGWRFDWYVFNLADVAIGAGVVGLLYEALRGETPQKRPDRA